MKLRYYVYLIKSEKTGELYTGFTEKLDDRVKQHNSGTTEYTKNKGPWELVWFAAFNERRKALDFEKYMKAGSGYAFARKRFM